MSFGNNFGDRIGSAATDAVRAVTSRRDDAEDLFAHTRMSLGDHIEDLRRHMIKALLGFALAMVVGFFVSGYVLEFINAPVEGALMDMYKTRLQKAKEKYNNKDATLMENDEPQPFRVLISPLELRKILELPTEGVSAEKRELMMDLHPGEIYIAQAPFEKLVGRPPKLAALGVTEVFMVYLKVSMYCGFVLASPWIFYQAWMFVAAGLYPHERRHVHLYLPFSLGLFLAGVALCEFIVMPMGIRYLLSWNEYLGIEPELRLTDWLSFAIMMPLIFGAAFQTPLVMFFIERVGLVDVTFYQKHRKMSIFVLALVGGLLSVSPDLVSMLLLVVPMWILYEVGILLCKYMPRHEIDDLDVPQSEELIEV